MFDQLFEDSPMIQKMREEYRVKGLQEGLQHSLVNVVRARYPDLAELAQKQVGRFNMPDALDLFIQQVVTAPNADTVRWLLESGMGV